MDVPGKSKILDFSVRLEHADIHWWITNRDEGGFDNSKSRELLKIIHAFSKTWCPLGPCR